MGFLSKPATVIAGALTALALSAPHASALPGGQPASAQDGASTVAITFVNSFLCGGALIGPSLVLTAASCVDGAPINSLAVRAGSLQWNTGGEAVGITKVTVYEGFNPLLPANDIALLQLAQPVTAQPAALPAADAATPPQLTATGWGVTKYLGPPEENLLEAGFRVVNNSVCDTLLEGLTASNLCITGTAPHVSLCEGDTGDPLISDGTVYGIALYDVYGGCRGPAIGTRVASYIDWINTHS